MAEYFLPQSNPYKLILEAASQIPIFHYAIATFLVFAVVIYNFLEIHFFQDLFSGFRGQRVSLVFNPSSDLYDCVVSKCRTLHGRYLVTPWLSSPHVQTGFLNFFGRPPVFNFRRQLYTLTDGGTLALDWLSPSDVAGGNSYKNIAMSKDDKTPLIFVIPGLMSDSDSSYIKHLVFNTVKHGWNVVVGNHRGLGGISITSDCFYNAGWTEDIREVIDYLHDEYPMAPLFVAGTSIGANILVKYLGEDGESVPIAGAAAICSPWDLLIGDRFISRKLQQKFYDKALSIGLKAYAHLHQPFYSRLADWEGIRKSRSIRDFDHYATRIVGKYETVDTYYRRCSSTSFVRTVSVPLLCLSAMDDPVCTKEAIPWDECRANKNIVLATTEHGGHLGFFEGVTASQLWWVKAVIEYFDVLHSSQLMHIKKKNLNQHPPPLESSIDQGPFLNVTKDGLVAAVGNDSINHVLEDTSEVHNLHDYGTNDTSEPNVQYTEQDNHIIEAKNTPESNVGETSMQGENNDNSKPIDVTSPIRKCLNELSRRNGRSMWLLAYVALITSWPLLGSAFRYIYKRRGRILPATLGRK